MRENATQRPGRDLHRFDDMATCVAFLLLLLAPLIMVVFGVGRDGTILRNGEYRLPAPRPGIPWTPAEIMAFPWQWEEYWRDVFPFRGELIHAHADVRYKKLGANAQDMVFLPGGYVFSIEEIDCYRGRMARTDEELVRFLEMVRRKREFFRQHGVSYYFLLAPSRIDFHRDLLDPVFALPVDHVIKSRLSRFMPESLQGCFIMPDETMRRYQAIHPDRPLFFRRDNHWTDWGRVVGAAALVERIRIEHPEVPALNPDDIPMIEAREDERFWAYLRLLGVDFDAFPAPMTVMAAPEWRANHARLAGDPGHRTTSLIYSSDSFMEIMAECSPEILSFADARRLDPSREGIKSPEAATLVLAGKPDIIVESVFIDALSSRHYYGYMETNEEWLGDDKP